MADSQNSTDFLAASDVVAVVGVSANQDKYGYKVFFDLVDKGYNVYAVHPDGGDIKGFKRYCDLKSLPFKPDLVISVVPPAVTEKIILSCVALGIKKIWMQPGSESQAAINLCLKNKLQFITQACIMINSIKKS